MSRIEWTERTWNPIVAAARGKDGRTVHWCTKISEGCRHCYAAAFTRRFGGPEYKRGAAKFRLDVRVLQRPASWRKPSMVFVCSMTDLFHDRMPETYIDHVYDVVQLTPQHTYQVITKRAGGMRAYMAQFPGGLPPNLWLGVSAETENLFDQRIAELGQIDAAVRFVSFEPLLGCIDTADRLDLDRSRGSPGLRAPASPRRRAFDWAIIGGESGPKARPMDLDWVRYLRDQLRAAGVPMFLKQLGTHWARRAGARSYKGSDPAEWPDDLQNLRAWPETARGGVTS